METSTRFLASGIKIALPAILVAGVLYGLSVDSILFESTESRTSTGDPVVNQIRYFSEGKRDIWMMNQSHSGRTAGADQWDRLAIIIDREKKSARFLQIVPGPLVWSDELLTKQKPFRVSCFFCHANGLRAIRPLQESLSFRERLAVSFWNLKIKSYGRLVADPTHEAIDKLQTKPFRSHAAIDNERLKTPICVSCHRDVGLFARGALTRQNAMTIRFMVESGQMPPFGISLSEQERVELRNFTNGM